MSGILEGNYKLRSVQRELDEINSDVQDMQESLKDEGSGLT